MPRSERSSIAEPIDVSSAHGGPTGSPHTLVCDELDKRFGATHAVEASR